ncbi:MAG: hypothetical protein ABR538_13620 [Candidatus Binatia bacterium]
MNVRAFPVRPAAAMRCGCFLLLATVAALAGCGGVGAPPPGWGEDDHGDIEIGATGDGEGALAIDFDFEEAIEVAFSQCFGGSGADCSGGIRLYSSEEPGFALLGHDGHGHDHGHDDDESLFPLPDGVEIELEVTAADPEASLFLEGKTLQNAGDRGELGETPDLHAHGSWQLALPGGEEPADSYRMVLRLHAGNGFEPSAEYVVLLTPVDD